MFPDRVLSGMRPTGRMHIGHYHGALKNWIRLQEEYECLFFAADWHALTTHFDSSEVIAESVWDMFVDWLAAGIDPTRATLFIQSRVPEHAELTLLLGMIAPVGEDPVSHIEVTRELARRFNHIYGREPGFEDKARAAVKKLGSKKAKRYDGLRTAFQQQGDTKALETARELLEDTQNLSLGDRE